MMKIQKHLAGIKLLPVKTNLAKLMSFGLMILLIALPTMANDALSQSVNVRMAMRNSTVADVIKEFSKQTGYEFSYDAEILNRKVSAVSINAKSENVETVLKQIFEGADIDFKIVNNRVFLKNNKTSESAPGTSVSAVQQQGKTVTGVVVDNLGDPVIGATIVVRGDAGKGTVTDIDGRFTLSNVPENAVLEISYVGMKTQTVNTAGKTSLNIALLEDLEMLDELVVVGYGTTSTRMIAGSVSSLKTDKIEDLPFTNASSALQGRTPGVVIQAGGGEPGSKPRVSIRGGGTPLYVIDGVIRNENDFNSLNSSDIDKISILKDASATAVYGARAGDGIILVQTKRGKQGKTTIQYTGGIDFSRPVVLPKKVSSLDYVLAANQAARYDGRTDLPYSDSDIEKIKNNSDPYGSITANTDWMGLALRDYAFGNRHNLSLSGVSENGINFYTAIGYLQQNSLFKESHNNKYDRLNLRSNVSNSFDNIGLEVGVNIDASLEKRNPTVWGNYTIWSQLQNVKPNYAAFNPDGTYSSISIHPLVLLDKRAGYNKENDKFINTQIYANWDIPTVDGLRVGVLGNIRYGDWNQKIFQSKAPQHQSNGVTVPYTSNYLRMSNSNDSQTSMDVNVQYKKDIDLHNLEFQAVYSYYKSYGENFWAQREKYMSSQFDQLFAGDASTQKNSGTAEERGRLGYVGRVKYDWNRRYMFEGNFRVDQSDNFPVGQRTGFFPSGALAWVVSEEPFMKTLTESNVVNFFKFRTSYGVVGLEDGVRFGYLPVYNMNSQSVIIDGNFTTGFSEGPLVSNDLSWYTRQVFDVGFDISFLDDRLFGIFDYYYYRTKGYLIAPQNRYTTPLGKDLPFVKSESAHRRAGYEANIRWKDKVGDFAYDLGVNFTKYDELWEKKEDESMSDLMNPNLRVTHTKNYYGRAYKTYGLYQNIEDVLNNPRRESANVLKPGDLFFADLNGDGKIDGEDFERIGKPTFPSFSYGFDFNLDYKNFFLYGLLQGTGPRYRQLSEFMRATNTEYLSYDFQLDYWTPDNRDALFPRLSTYQNLNSGQNYTVSSDFWYHNAQYLRLKSLQFGYDFSDLIKSSKSISALRISLTGSNIFTLSKVNKFYDPELTDDTGYAYPTQKSYSIVLNVTF